ncbi:MAG: glutamine synthetase beta-grasp domain-containing protein [Hydrogeniiclostridium mannosilyticum]
MAIMAGQLKMAFEEGIIFDASAVKGFQTVEHSDLFLVPDGSTVTILPWRPSHERVMRICCNVKNPDGTDFEGYSRNILKKAVQRSVDMGYICNIGTECEFYLFKTDEAGEPTTEPFDHGGYNDIAPLDKCENIRREICLAIEEMGLLPESSHHERGPGQNEVDFRYSDALSAADNFITFKMVVKSIAAQNGSGFFSPAAHQESGTARTLTRRSQEEKPVSARGQAQCKCRKFHCGILARSAEMAAFEP